MTDSPETPNPGDSEPKHDPSTDGPAKASSATAILDSIRDAFDDIADRATPAVREVSARAAELTAVAAAKAAPYAKKAGDATADATGKLAERSRTWAAEVRAAMDSEAAKTAPSADDVLPGANGSNGSAGTHEATPSDPATPGDAPTSEH